ncbi:MAG: peptide chain release factor N(5)-glutamine methyltransferase [Firmicutes bacterium]|nr:peptide chain release factor N(5)-glutamine methyltransferase [Bacillota bacterium]
MVKLHSSETENFGVYRTEINNLFARFQVEQSDADFLFCDIFGVTRPRLAMIKSISDKQKKLMQRYAARRIAGEPVQYIIGHTDFYGTKILVDKRVMIPRYDTEILVSTAARFINKQSAPYLKVLDLCTGSGAIAIALQKKTGVVMTASDISKPALQLAGKNAKLNNVKVELVKSDMFRALSGREFDMIISNPPYISVSGFKTLNRTVQKHEPRIALTDEGDGYFYYRKIAGDAHRYLVPGGRLVLEVGAGQAKEVERLLRAKFVSLEIIKDLQGIERVVTGVKRGKELY